MIWQLFISFLKIGAFTFGGGYAMVPLIEREVIEKRGWAKAEEFLELLTLAQSAPGPIALNTAVFVGYRVRGFWGAIVAILGIVLPAFAIILTVAIFFADIRNNTTVDAAFKAMRPAVVALIVAPIIGLAKSMNKYLLIVSLAVALAIWGVSVSPIYLLFAGAVAGVIRSLSITKNREER